MVETRVAPLKISPPRKYYLFSLDNVLNFSHIHFLAQSILFYFVNLLTVKDKETSIQLGLRGCKEEEWVDYSNDVTNYYFCFAPRTGTSPEAPLLIWGATELQTPVAAHSVPSKHKKSVTTSDNNHSFLRNWWGESA